MYSDDKLQGHFLILFFISFYVIVVLRNAWVSDDAYIAFRVVDNFVNGFGLRWNVVERVQAYSNPLWLILMIPSYWIIGQMYFAALSLSFLFLLGTMFWYAFKISESWAATCLGIFILTLSKTFIDFSTSGLENPLIYFLLAVGLFLFLRRETNETDFFLLCLVAGLASVNRLDSILMYIPMLLYSFWKIKNKRAVLLLAAGFSPLILWEMFSLFYYGFPFPNTAYVKLGSGISTARYLGQGFYYYLNALKNDPLAMMVIGLALVMPIMLKQKKAMMVSLGIFLTLLYILRIGGCFMALRHFAAPFFCSVVLLTQLAVRLKPGHLFVIGVVLVILTMKSDFSPLSTGSNERSKDKPIFQINSIDDERRFYFENTGLINFDKNAAIWPAHPWAYDGLTLASKGKKVIALGSIGMEGYFAGPKVFIIDKNALADPLLARIHLKCDKNFFPGHLPRFLPYGYEETIRTGRNVLTDRKVAKYYDRLSFITRGPLFSIRRLMEIVKFNFGAYEYLIKDYDNTKTIKVKLADINIPRSPETAWNDSDNYIIDRRGIEIYLDSLYRSERMELSYDNNDQYRVEFFNDSLMIGWHEIPLEYIGVDGLRVIEFGVPERATEEGYNQIKIYPVDGDDMYSVGHVRLIDAGSRTER